MTQSLFEYPGEMLLLFVLFAFACFVGATPAAQKRILRQPKYKSFKATRSLAGMKAGERRIMLAAEKAHPTIKEPLDELMESAHMIDEGKTAQIPKKTLSKASRQAGYIVGRPKPKPL